MMKTHHSEAGRGECLDCLAEHLKIILTDREAINEEHFEMVTVDRKLSKLPMAMTIAGPAPVRIFLYARRASFTHRAQSRRRKVTAHGRDIGLKGSSVQPITLLARSISALRSATGPGTRPNQS